MVPQLNSNDGKLVLSGKEGVNFTEAQETHVVEQTHSDDSLTVKGYIGNKWLDTAKEAYKNVQDSANGSGDIGKTYGSVKAVGQTMNGIGDSAKTSGTLGFYGGVELSKESNSTTQITGQTLAIGSTFNRITVSQSNQKAETCLPEAATSSTQVKTVKSSSK